MKGKITAILLLISVFIFTEIHSQNSIKHKQYSTFEIINDSSIPPETVYKILLGNAPVEPQYPNIPRFAIVGKNNKFYLSIGATIKATASFDFGNPFDYPDTFIPSNIEQTQEGNGGKFQATLRRSKIHFSFVALPGTKNQFSTYISIKFTGNNNKYGATLQNAYAKYSGFTAGYKNNLYSDNTAMPYTIDNQGPNSSPCITNTCINYEHTFNNNISLGIGLESPLYNITETSNSVYNFSSGIIKSEVIGKTEAVSQRIPDIPFYINYKIKDKGHIRVSAIIRDLEYRNVNAEKNVSQIGWGIKLSSKYKTGGITAFLMGQYGSGIASYLQDNNMGIDLVPDSETPGKMKLSKSWGAYLGIQYDIIPALSATVIYSHLRNYLNKYNGGRIEYENNYKWGQYLCTNIIYSINPFVQCGIEYIYGQRMNFNKIQNHNNRIQTLFQITF